MNFVSECSDLTPTPGFVVVTLTSNPVLAAGTRYWLGLSSAGSGDWAFNSDTSGVGVSGEFYYTMGRVTGEVLDVVQDDDPGLAAGVGSQEAEGPELGPKLRAWNSS
jgi:hypothetical protein